MMYMEENHELSRLDKPSKDGSTVEWRRLEVAGLCGSLMQPQIQARSCSAGAQGQFSSAWCKEFLKSKERMKDDAYADLIESVLFDVWET